jgi:signal transduction histidine kinase
MDANKKDGQNILLKPSEASFHVFQDPKLLSHVLINLLSNAIKYSNENQDIVLNITTSAKQVILTIVDEGIGIPEEEQKKLFSRFFRADNANNIQGTGLGLHIVKQYVELMGGTVSFMSKVDKETSFRVKLPLKMVERKIIN